MIFSFIIVLLLFIILPIGWWCRHWLIVHHNTHILLISLELLFILACTPKHFRHHTFWPTCDTNGWYPNQPEASQLSPPLTCNRKDQVRLTSAGQHHRYQPSIQKILRIPNSDSEFLRIPRMREKVFCVESVPTLRIIQFKLLISNIRTCNLEQLFQWRRCLIYTCHVRAHALPTQNGNYQLQRWIGQNPKHLKGLQR